jgi:hypothetical protein
MSFLNGDENTSREGFLYGEQQVGDDGSLKDVCECTSFKSNSDESGPEWVVKNTTLDKSILVGDDLTNP